MIKRPIGFFALATLGLVLAAPVQAAPNFMEGLVVVAKRDQGDEAHQDQRDNRRDERRSSRREAERDAPQGYGYGYERRQQERVEEDNRQRGRR